ncbi:MAG: TRAP transporter small permease [Geminicoccaceae bacterium]|nr:TRAP transporter small permease [Geminicoccaceae bacterium]
MNALERAAGALQGINNSVLGICRLAVILIVGGLAVLLSCAVFWRYALNNAIPWSEEAAKYLMVWLTFVGAPVALRDGAHVSIDVLPAALSGRARQVALFLINVVIILVCVMLIWQGGLFAKLGARQVASSFQLSMFWVYLAVPLGGFLLLLVSLGHALRALIGIGDPDRGLVESHDSYAEEVRE